MGAQPTPCLLLTNSPVHATGGMARGLVCRSGYRRNHHAPEKPLRRLLHASMGSRHVFAVLLNPFCPFSKAKVLALKATVLLLPTPLFLQTLKFLSASGGLVLASSGAALYATQQRRPAVA